MTKEKEVDDIFAEVLPNEKPAYPQHIYIPTGKNYPNGEPICTSYVVKNVEEHKALLDSKNIDYPGKEKSKGDPSWGKDKK